LIEKESVDDSSMDSDAHQATINGSNSKVEDDDAQAKFLNDCIKRDSLDFEKSVADKRKANIDGKREYIYICLISI